MGSWNGTVLGLKVKPAEKNLAKQLLTCLGVDTDDYIIEEVGPLSKKFIPSIIGVVKGSLLGARYFLEEHYNDYINQFYDFYGEEEENDYYEEDGTNGCIDDAIFDFQLDDLLQITTKVFPKGCVYLAHEEGNNTSDTYYRYEAILDPTLGTKTEFDCFYSYGDGIHVDAEEPKEEVTEKREAPIVRRLIDAEIVDYLIRQANANQFSELVAKLSK